MRQNRVYHYTSVDGFYSMMRNRSLRITRSDFLNDQLECNVFYKLVESYCLSDYGRKAYRDLLEYVIENNGKFKMKKEEFKEIAQSYSIVDHIQFLLRHIDYYVFSTTVKKDSLIMWNYYGTGGIQLTFDRKKLFHFLKSKLQPSQVLIAGKVNYVNEAISLKESPMVDYQITSQCDEKIIEFIKSKKKDGKLFFDKQADHLIFQFIQNCIHDLLNSLAFLYNTGKIDKRSQAEDIFRELFENANRNKNEDMEFKKVISSNLIALSSLFKIDSYKEEEEYRFVIFNNSLEKTESDYFLGQANGLQMIKPGLELHPFAFDQFMDEVLLSPITKNLPVEHKAYCNVIDDFIKSIFKGIHIHVRLSQHKTRW